MLSESALQSYGFPTDAEISTNGEALEVWTKWQKVRNDIELLPSGNSVKGILVYDVNKNILPLINQSFKLRDWTRFPATWAREYKSLMQMLYNIEQQLSAQTQAPTTVQRPPSQPTVTSPMQPTGDGTYVDIFRDPQTGMTVDELLGFGKPITAASAAGKKGFAFDSKTLIIIAVVGVAAYFAWSKWGKKGKR